jgi:hypothetical protein
VVELVYAWGCIPDNAVAPGVFRELVRALAT